MIEIFTIVALTGLLAWERYQNRKERGKLINAIMSKNAQELTNLEIADKTKIELKDSEQDEPDLIPFDRASDEVFNKLIEKERERTTTV